MFARCTKPGSDVRLTKELFCSRKVIAYGRPVLEP